MHVAVEHEAHCLGHSRGLSLSSACLLQINFGKSSSSRPEDVIAKMRDGTLVSRTNSYHVAHVEGRLGIWGGEKYEFRHAPVGPVTL